MTTHARQRETRRELRTVGVEEGESPGGGWEDGNLAGERRRVETHASTITPLQAPMLTREAAAGGDQAQWLPV